MEEIRIFNTVLNDLINDRLKLEEELERCVNLNCNTNKKINKIKYTLNKLVKCDLMIGKWKDYLPTNEEK